MQPSILGKYSVSTQHNYRKIQVFKTEHPLRKPKIQRLIMIIIDNISRAWRVVTLLTNANIRTKRTHKNGIFSHEYAGEPNFLTRYAQEIRLQGMGTKVSPDFAVPKKESNCCCVKKLFCLVNIDCVFPKNRVCFSVLCKLEGVICKWSFAKS